MKTKPLTFLLVLTFLFLFSGSVYGDEEVKKEYFDNGKLKTETHYKNGIKEGLETNWYPSGKKGVETHYKNGKKEGLETGRYKNGKKKHTKHFRNGIENGLRTEWDEDGKKTFQGNFLDGAEEIIKTTEGLKGLERKNNITGVWCGKPVDKQENCKGDDIGFLNVKQVGVGLGGEFCMSYQDECYQVRAGEVSGNNVTFSLVHKGIQMKPVMRLLDDNYLKGTFFNSKCDCDMPISFFRINSEEASTNIPFNLRKFLRERD